MYLDTNIDKVLCMFTNSIPLWPVATKPQSHIKSNYSLKIQIKSSDNGIMFFPYRKFTEINEIKLCKIHK